MKKHQFIKVLIFLFAFALLSSVVVVPTKALDYSVVNNPRSNIHAQTAEEASTIAVVKALFTNNSYNELKSHITQGHIVAANLLVRRLNASNVKSFLTSLISTAQHKFDNRQVIKMVLALYRCGGDHPIIRDDLNQAEITNAKERVEALPNGSLKTELTRIMFIVRDQFATREIVYSLFTDHTHTTIKPNLNQYRINITKNIVSSLSDEWPIKAQLNALLDKAQVLFNQLKDKNLTNISKY